MQLTHSSQFLGNPVIQSAILLNITNVKNQDKSFSLLLKIQNNASVLYWSTQEQTTLIKFIYICVNLFNIVFKYLEVHLFLNYPSIFVFTHQLNYRTCMVQEHNDSNQHKRQVNNYRYKHFQNNQVYFTHIIIKCKCVSYRKTCGRRQKS